MKPDASLLTQKIHEISFNVRSELNEQKALQILMGPAQGENKKFELEQHTQALSESEKNRLELEIFEEGPLFSLLLDEQITEIMIHGPEQIWFEKNGKIYKHSDCFLSNITFNNFIHRFSAEAQIKVDLNIPYGDGRWKDFRVHMIIPPLAPKPIITLRKLRSSSLSLEDLCAKSWCSIASLEQLKQLVLKHKNILVVGNTGSGKTTLLNALLKEIPNERCLLIEDTKELVVSNTFSPELLTRFDSQNILSCVDQSILLKQALRMRPDRLIIGEVRGSEAKDLLMALSTGHKGSMASLHAHTPQEALLRLEMLIQMGASQWSLEAIRRLIQLTIDNIIVTRKDNGRWYLKGIYKISSLESFGFSIEEIY